MPPTFGVGVDSAPWSRLLEHHYVTSRQVTRASLRHLRMRRTIRLLFVILFKFNTKVTQATSHKLHKPCKKLHSEALLQQLKKNALDSA